MTRGRRISPEELRLQLEEEGADWDIVPMDTIIGSVVAAEDIPIILPVAAGLNVLEEVRRDICSVSQEYPIGAVIASRRSKEERTFALRRELAHQAYLQACKNRKKEALDELGADVRRLSRITVPVRGA